MGTSFGFLFLRYTGLGFRLQLPHLLFNLIFSPVNPSSLVALHVILLFLHSPRCALDMSHRFSTHTELPLPWFPPPRCLGQSEGLFPQLPHPVHPEDWTSQMCPHLNLSSHLRCLATGLLPVRVL